MYVALAHSAIEAREFDNSSVLIEGLEINPRLLDALLLRCDLELINGQYPTGTQNSTSKAAAINARSQWCWPERRPAICCWMVFPTAKELTSLLDQSEIPTLKQRKCPSRFTKLAD